MPQDSALQIPVVLIEPLEERTLLAATKIMPLGDSITASEVGHASYRYWLWNSLLNGGYTNIDFVGSLTGVNGGSPTPSNFDQNHEGHWGWRADEINGQIAGWAGTYKPDIVLMHLGTNDLNQGQSVSSTITDLGSIIDKLRAANPNVTVLMAQIIPNTTNPTAVTQLNAQIPTLASQKNTSQSRVIAVDQWTGFSTSTDLYDGIHPNSSGEQKMSGKWYTAVTPFLSTTPPPPPPAGTYLSDLNPTLATNGWGPYERDRSNGEQGAGDGGTITLNGVTYSKGLGVHAASELRYTLSGQYSQFLADIGVDDEVGSGGSVVFQVWDNLGNKLYDSAKMTGSTATKSITVNVTGKQEIRLIVTNSGDNFDSDHADWAFARLILATPTGPVVSAFNGGTINEGGTYTSSGSFTDSSSSGPWTATVNYGDGGGNQALTLNSDKTFALSHVYADNGSYTVTVTVSNGITSGNKTAGVTVNNVAPSVTMPPNSSVNIGSPYSDTGSFSDPGTLDTWTATVNYGDGSGTQALTLNPDKTFSLSKTYAQGGSYTITVTVKDKDNASTSATTVVTVLGAPVVNTFSGATINEGGTYSASGSFTDSTAGPWTATVDYGDGSGVLPLTLNANKTFALSHVYADNGAFTVTVTVNNGIASGVKTAAVTVNNVAPSVTMPPAATVNYGTPFSGNGSFSDPGVNDTFTGTVDYGDGSGVQALTLNANKTFSLNRNYAAGGTFTITVTIKDNANASTSATTTVTVNGAPVQQTTYLSDLTPTFASNGWGPYEKDRSNGEQGATDGKPMKINGVSFTKGLGVHAASELRYNINKQFDRFVADVGIDDETNGGGSVRFLVYGDGVLLADSGVVRGRQNAVRIDVAVTNVTELKLVVNDGGDGAAYDHGDWGGARVTKNSAPVFTVNQIPGATINEGSAYSATGSFTDPNPGSWTATVNYGDGSGDQSLTLNADKTFALSHVYADNGNFIVTVTVDNGTTQVSNTGAIVVNNVAPIFSLGADAASSPSFTRNASFVDPGADTWSATVDYGDGTGVKPLTLNADKTFTLNNVYIYNGTYQVKVTIVDDDGGSGTSTMNVTVTGGQAPPLTYLSDLNTTFASNGWGTYERDRSNGEQGANDGRTITIAGQTYAKGLGVHAASELRYNLSGTGFTTFATDYGVDDETGGAGSVRFQVWLDGVLVWDSGTVRGGQAAKSFSINVAGKSELKLVVTDNGDGKAYDHGDWANARFVS